MDPYTVDPLGGVEVAITGVFDMELKGIFRLQPKTGVIPAGFYTSGGVARVGGGGL